MLCFTADKCVSVLGDSGVEKKEKTKQQKKCEELLDLAGDERAKSKEMQKTAAFLPATAILSFKWCDLSRGVRVRRSEKKRPPHSRE